LIPTSVARGAGPCQIGVVVTNSMKPPSRVAGPPSVEMPARPAVGTLATREPVRESGFDARRDVDTRRNPDEGPASGDADEGSGADAPKVVPAVVEAVNGRADTRDEVRMLLGRRALGAMAGDLAAAAAPPAGSLVQRQR
jgi:hypothetical protein